MVGITRSEPDFLDLIRDKHVLGRNAVQYRERGHAAACESGPQQRYQRQKLGMAGGAGRRRGGDRHDHRGRFPGKLPERHSRKALLIAAFTFLALRNGLTVVSHNPWYLIALQGSTESRPASTTCC